MIKEFVTAFDKKRGWIRDELAKKQPESYQDLVTLVTQAIHDDINSYTKPDPKRIHLIDDGDWQGTLVFIIASTGYQPDTYWYCKISYGSCSGCDTLEAIKEYSCDAPTEKQISEYMTLALHIVQGLKKMYEDEV